MRTLEDIRNLLNAGADKVSINTAAVRAAGICARGRRAIWHAMYRGGDRCQTSGASSVGGVYARGAEDRPVLNVSRVGERMERYGAGEILLTSMDQDGRQNGYDLGLTAAVSERVSDSRDSLRGCRNAGASVRRVRDRQGGCRVGGLDFSFPDPYDSGGKSLFAGSRRSRSIRLPMQVAT